MCKQNCRIIVAKNIKKFMDKKGKTQNDIIKDLKISSSVISGWCNAVSFPRIEKLELLANYLEVNVIDFFIENNNTKKDMEELTIIINQLDEEYRKILISQANALLEMQKKK